MSESPTDELRANAWPALLQPKSIPLIFALVLLFGLNFSITLFEVNDEFAGIVIGSVFAQIVLFAVWCTLAPVHFGTRLLTGSIAFAFAAICMFRCAQRDGGGNQVAITIAGAMFVQWLLYQLPLWHTRRKGWVLSSGNLRQAEATNELQFGISQLLTWTTVVAVFLGVMRFLLSGGETIKGGLNLVEIEAFAMMSMGSSLLVLPLIYASFSKNRMGLWTGVAVVWAVGLSITQWIFLDTRSGDVEFLLLINLAQFVAVFGTLLLVRLAGIRLQRRLASS